MAVQIIITPGGEELVLLPRADYEALVRRADLAPAGGGDPMPAQRKPPVDPQVPVRSVTLHGKQTSHRF